MWGYRKYSSNSRVSRRWDLNFLRPLKRGHFYFALTIYKKQLTFFVNCVKKAAMSLVKTFIPKQNDIKREYLLVDAKDKTLGRLSSRIAKILQGKNKPYYTPFLLCGDFVIVINARHIKVTGNKLKDKIYDKYSGYPSGRKEISLEKLLARKPEKILYLAVKGMLPKNRLARRMLNSLKIYPDKEHLHTAQKPKRVEL